MKFGYINFESFRSLSQLTLMRRAASSFFSLVPFSHCSLTMGGTCRSVLCFFLLIILRMRILAAFFRSSLLGGLTGEWICNQVCKHPANLKHQHVHLEFSVEVWLTYGIGCLGTRRDNGRRNFPGLPVAGVSSPSSSSSTYRWDWISMQEGHDRTTMRNSQIEVYS